MFFFLISLQSSGASKQTTCWAQDLQVTSRSPPGPPASSLWSLGDVEPFRAVFFCIGFWSWILDELVLVCSWFKTDARIPLVGELPPQDTAGKYAASFSAATLRYVANKHIFPITSRLRVPARATSDKSAVIEYMCCRSARNILSPICWNFTVGGGFEGGKTSLHQNSSWCQ